MSTLVTLEDITNEVLGIVPDSNINSNLNEDKDAKKKFMLNKKMIDFNYIPKNLSFDEIQSLYNDKP